MPVATSFGLDGSVDVPLVDLLVTFLPFPERRPSIIL